jgi:hypothetical protein
MNLQHLIAAAIVAAAFLNPAAAFAETGATHYEDGSCQEADGTPGQSMPDGSCVTIADYDQMFSYENLSTVPSAINPDLSIAEEAGMVPDTVPPSQRDLGGGVTAEPHRFVDYFGPVAYVLGLPIRLA